MAEKTEKPTTKRLKESAKKGQTFKSKDLITTVTLIIGICFLAWGMNLKPFVDFYAQLLLYGQQPDVGDYFQMLLRIFFMLAMPFIALCTAVGMVATLLQTRFTIATEAIKLNFKALNPVEGIKKIFTLRTVKELVKSLCYLLVFVCACYTLIHHDLRQVLTLYRADITTLISVWVSLTVKAVMVFIAWSIFVLLADFIVEYFLYFKDLKMDKHEVKQEYKESEGNPQIKNARRQAHHDILSGEDMAAIRNSEMIMANPTHIAMAIYFNPEVAFLPFIALRHKNMKARAVIAYAEKIGVPVVRNISLARQLYQTYDQHSFISINDEALIRVMKILIWLRQVEQEEIEYVEASGDHTDTLATDAK